MMETNALKIFAILIKDASTNHSTVTITTLAPLNTAILFLDVYIRPRTVMMDLLVLLIAATLKLENVFTNSTRTFATFAVEELAKLIKTATHGLNPKIFLPNAKLHTVMLKLEVACPERKLLVLKIAKQLANHSMHAIMLTVFWTKKLAYLNVFTLQRTVMITNLAPLINAIKDLDVSTLLILKLAEIILYATLMQSALNMENPTTLTTNAKKLYATNTKESVLQLPPTKNATCLNAKRTVNQEILVKM
jgi:hypothetical protein